MTTRISTPFGATSTALQVVAGVDLSGRSAVVTGAASGIGVGTARALASTGAAVTLAVHDQQAGERVAAGITATTGKSDVKTAPLTAEVHRQSPRLVAPQSWLRLVDDR